MSSLKYEITQMLCASRSALTQFAAAQMTASAHSLFCTVQVPLLSVAV